MDATVGNKKGNTVIQVIAASMIAVIVSLVLILLSAAIINALDVDSDIWLTVINQIIKGVSLLAGCLIMFKNVRNGWLKGLVTGIVYIVLSFVVLLSDQKRKIRFNTSALRRKNADKSNPVKALAGSNSVQTLVSMNSVSDII